MTEETQSDTDAESQGPLAGQRLARARREREISVLDIAKELHLDEPKVRALENNEFEILGAPVFAKGHLRKYAELVGVPIDDVLVDYYSLNRAVGAPPVVGPPRKRQRNVRIGPLVVAILIIAVVASIAYWWLGRTGTTAAIPSGETPRIETPAMEPPTADAGAEEPVAELAGPPATPSDAPESSPPAETATGDEDDATPGSTLADVAEAAAEPPPSLGGPMLTLGMRFSGDCWTEVTDASGSRLYFDLGRAGRSRTISGEAPLRVLFGNSDNVALTVNGEDFAIPDSMRRGQTARLTINAQ